MSNRFHSKWHRTSHQTYKNPNILDAGWDPIASHDVPFSGDFVMAPSVSGWCVSAEKNSLGYIYSWSPNNVITIDAHHDPSAEPPDPDNSTINLVAGIINFDISETNINGHLNVRDWVEISGMSGDGDTGYGLIVHESAVVSGDTSAIGDITTDGNLYVTGSEPSAGSAYFKSISATEATIVSALINEVDISASESNGYIMKTPNPQGKIIPNPMSISAGVNNFYLSGDTLYSDSWGYFEGELKTASALYAGGPVTAASSITTNKNLYVAGNAQVGAFGSFGTYVSAAGSDDNGYGLIIKKNATIKGNTDIGGTLGVTGAVDFDFTLNVDGATTLNSLGVTNNATVGGTLGVTGATTLNTLNATGAVDFDSTLNVDGATTLNSLGVTNNATVGGTLGVTGATTLSSTLGVTGAVDFDSTLTVGSRASGSTVGTNSVAEGHNTTAGGNYSHAEGNGTTASEGAAHAEGTSTTASGESSHVEGNSTVAIGNSSHAEGAGTTARGFASHSEGENATASGNSSHAEGGDTTASGIYSHAEGVGTTASGAYSHAEGAGTTASGSASHAEGTSTTASGESSHAEGNSTIAQNGSEHAQGQYNKSTKTSDTFGTAGNTLHSVGFGTDDNARKNAHEITQDGANFIYGVGGYNGTNATVGTNDLATVISSITSRIGDIDSVLDEINGEAI